MRSFAVATALFSAVALASPFDMNLPILERTSAYTACNSTLYVKPKCCKVNVDGIVNLDCASPGHSPGSLSEFTSICAGDELRTPRCCVVTILDVAVLCQGPPDERNP